MWARRPELANEIHEAKRNSEYLPGINLPREMYATHHLSEALDGAEQVYLSIPSQAVRQNLKAVRPLVASTDAPIVSLMKGVERRTGLRMSQVIEQELHCDPSRIAVASGPEPRPRDRARAADGRRHLVDEPGDGGCRRPPRPQPATSARS